MSIDNYIGCLQFRADQHINNSILSLSTYNDSVIAHIMVSSIDAINNIYKSNKSNKEFMNIFHYILRLYRLDEIVDVVGSKNLKTLKSNATKQITIRGGGSSSDRKKKLALRSTASANAATNPALNTLARQNSDMTVEAASANSIANSFPDDRVSSILKHSERQQKLSMKMGEGMILNARKEYSEAQRNLLDAQQALSQAEERIKEEANKEYERLVQEYEATYTIKERELASRVLVERGSFAVAGIPAGLFGYTMGQLLNTAIAGTTAFIANAAQSFINQAMFWEENQCRGNFREPFLVPGVGSTCVPGRFYGETCTYTSNPACVGSEGWGIGQHAGLQLGIFCAVTAGCTAWMATRVLRGQTHATNTVRGTGVINSLKFAGDLAVKISVIGILLQTVQSSPERAELEATVLRGKIAVGRDGTLLDRQKKIEEALKTFAEGQRKYLLQNVETYEKALNEAREEQKRLNSVASDMIVEASKLGNRMVEATLNAELGNTTRRRSIKPSKAQPLSIKPRKSSSSSEGAKGYDGGRYKRRKYKTHKKYTR